MSIVVRAASPEDIAAISRVLIASITELCAQDHGNDAEALAAWTRNKTIEGVGAMLANPALRMVVAIDDPHLVAVGAITTDGQIALNYVAPEARFRGISKAILSRLETDLVALGHDEGRLEATSTARRFYERCGWIADGPQATGRKVNGYPMRKTLR